MQNLITKHLDVWTSAHKTRSTAGRGSSNKLELYGIKKLRELILELAVRGKLVPQDPNDEPASELLKRIAHDIAESEKPETIKKDMPVSVNSDDEPFDLPTGWEMVSFGNICTIERGGSPRPIQDFLTNAPDGINWIKIGDSDIGGKYITSTAEKIRKEGLVKTRMVYPGDFLLTNSMSFGRPYITQIEGCIHDGWLRISPPKELDKDFLYYLLSSPFIFKSFKKAAAGAVVLNLNADKVRVVELLLPPLAEQHRIVAKVDELMAFCDQLEQTQSDNIAAHAQLVEALLATLTDSRDHNELQTNWQRIAAHFDTLFTTEHAISQLKQTILQLAVMGKLVPQNPSDEPASELLKKIAAEKAQLIKEGKIKKEKPLPEITEEEKPFELPSGWEWCRLSQITSVRGGSTPSMAKSAFWGGNIPWVSPKDMHDGVIKTSELKITEQALRETTLELVPIGSILIVGRSGILKRKLPAQITEVPCTVNQDIKAVTPIMPLPDRYLQLMFWGNEREILIRDVKQGTTVQSLVYESLFSRPFAIPPIAEQHRIVKKVDELMALCDTLKTNLQHAQATQLALADALVEQAI